jgi:cytochrome c oxidase assembly protein subunit 15
VAALGDTLFPATSFEQGLALGPEVPAEVRALLRLRIAHPLMAVVAAGAVLVAARVSHAARPDPRVRRAGVRVALIVAVQLLAGAANVWLLAPVWLQLAHLLLADLLWISLVLLAAATLAPGEVQAQGGGTGLEPAPGGSAATARGGA